MVTKSSPRLLFARLEVGDKRLDAAVPSQRARRGRQVRQRRELEGHVARVAGDGGEELGVAHGQHQRAEAARGLAADGAPAARGDGAKAAGRSRGSPRARDASRSFRAPANRGTGAAPAGEAVGRDDDRLAHRAGADQPIESLAQARLPGVPRKQHLARAAVAGQPVDHRITARRRARVRRRQPDGAPGARSDRPADCRPARGSRRFRSPPTSRGQCGIVRPAVSRRSIPCPRWPRSRWPLVSRRLGRAVPAPPGQAGQGRAGHHRVGRGAEAGRQELDARERAQGAVPGRPQGADRDGAGLLSRRDPRTSTSGIRGVAHMFEHMMFKGSTHVPPEEHARLLKEVGGEVNAFTTEDLTAYHDTVPPSYVGFALQLEAERMRQLKLFPATIDSERKVVEEEKRLRIDNDPVGKAIGTLPRAGLHPAPLQLDGDRDDRGPGKGHPRRLPALLRHLLSAQQRHADRRRRRGRAGRAQAGRPVLRGHRARSRARRATTRSSRRRRRRARRRCRWRSRSRWWSAATTSRAPRIPTCRRWRCWPRSCRRASRRA